MSNEIIMSIDAETDGLYGRVLAVAAIVTEKDSGEELAKFELRVDDLSTDNEWVEKNVIPNIIMMESTTNEESLLNTFWEFYNQWMNNETKKDNLLLAHMPDPVETGLFRKMVEMDLDNRQWLGPYDRWVTLEQVLRCDGRQPDSPDTYMQVKNLKLPEIYSGLSTHNPLYDAVVALQVYTDLIK